MTHYTKLIFSFVFVSLIGCDQLNKVPDPTSIGAKQTKTSETDYVENKTVETIKAENTKAHEVIVEHKAAKKNTPSKKARALKPQSYKTVEWTDLMPKEDFDALMNPPEYITEIEDGSIEDQLSNQMANAIGAATDDKYQQALRSTKVIQKLDGMAIRLPGFIVPLEFDDNQVITQFFLVPFFGACIHLPPPPPNQTIFVNYPGGLKLDSLVDPLWISGVLKVSMIENDVATAAYTLDMFDFEEYQE